MSDPALRDSVRRRAMDRCEYCGIRQGEEPFFLHQLEHIVARQHGGPTIESNLALACQHCNRHKGPNLSGIDPDTGGVTELFHPRRDRWEDHFVLRGDVIVGRSPIGRATVRVLKMNAVRRVELRMRVRLAGR